jgi:hypothetical protein
VVALLLLAFVSAAPAQAQRPSTTSGFFAGANYDEAKVAPYTLPDPLVCFDGTPVTSTAIWNAKRRPEILRTFETQVYGRAPAVNQRPRFEIISTDPTALGGTATRKQVKIWLLGTNPGPALELLLYLPNGVSRPVPAFLGLNFAGNQCVSVDPGVPVTPNWARANLTGVVDHRATEATRGIHASRWQVEKVLARGYAVATAYYGDIEPDHRDGWKTGLRGALGRDGAATVFAPEEWAATSAWAWGLSRIMDYLATDPAIDAARVAVHGHSRLGKTALWAGALDQRFALVISNCSGEGGASLMRRNFGETIAQANASEPHRFCGNFRRYEGAAGDLPVDAHLLIALMAPRPVYVASAVEDDLADPRGEFLAAKHAGPAFGLFGLKGLGSVERAVVDQPIGDVAAYHVRSGTHDITAYDWDQYLNFADRHFHRSPSPVR